MELNCLGRVYSASEPRGLCADSQSFRALKTRPHPCSLRRARPRGFCAVLWACDAISLKTNRSASSQSSKSRPWQQPRHSKSSWAFSAIRWRSILSSPTLNSLTSLTEISLLPLLVFWFLVNGKLLFLTESYFSPGKRFALRLFSGRRYNAGRNEIVEK